MKCLPGFAAIVFLSCCLQADDKKKDPDEIGDRDVGKGLNTGTRLKKRLRLANKWRNKSSVRVLLQTARADLVR
jgi:hypothetical protein